MVEKDLGKGKKDAKKFRNDRSKGKKLRAERKDEYIINHSAKCNAKERKFGFQVMKSSFRIISQSVQQFTDFLDFKIIKWTSRKKKAQPFVEV